MTAKQIKRFPRIRFLWLYGVIFQGDFTGCLPELKWISLQYSPFHHQCFEATNLLHLENVVVVNISYLDLTEDEVESLIKGARKLKVLTLLCIGSIHRKPTFPEFSVLEKLTISECPSLVEIDCSIGKLRWLTDLSIEFCSALRKLPEQIGELQNLRHLSLRWCRDLSELPDSVSKLVSLTHLDVSFTRITRLLDSIGRLPSQSTANVSRTPTMELPSTMSKFLHLQTLDLAQCHGIQELPKLPRSLTTLRLSSTSLLTVPNLSYLTNLVELLLSDGSNGGSTTSNLIQTCDLRWIGRLSRLSKLNFSLSNVHAPTTELGSLFLLKGLILCGLDLQTLKQLPSNLIVLELYRTRVKQVYLGGLPPLENETVFVSSSLRKLREKKVHEQCDVQFIDVLESSERSCIQDCKSSKSLVCLPEELGCNELQAPELVDRWRGAFLVPSSPKMLKEFRLWGCPEVQDIQFVSTLGSLEKFSVGYCISLKRVGGLSNLKNLKLLDIHWCKSLQVVEGIDELEFLQQLLLYQCRSMEMIFDALSSKISNECRIDVICCGKLLDSGPNPHIVTWESYREMIVNGTKQALDSEIETTESKTETGDPLKKMVRLLPIHRSLLFLPLYLLSISALF
ncbi:disease resistance protein RPV1-like [Syzygium oleosum]|uniref:disease resistance protein RPV1-like n=1 Tax=Syzygium oleosum TaxID=219896 RepID=UPI0024BA74B4|nr:disease resistance protein RPV1-like [Syzygium oleosum]